MMDAFVNVPDCLGRQEQFALLLRRHQRQVSYFLCRICAHGRQQSFIIFQPALDGGWLQNGGAVNALREYRGGGFQDVEFQIERGELLGGRQ